jgi:DNA primase
LRFAAAAAFLLVGYLAGRAAAPDADQLREALTPAVAASLEPLLREKLAREMRDHYDVALVGTYVRLKEELAQQYRDDLNRFAVQTLAASNATTNALLAELVQSIDTAQTQDRRRIALTLSQMEAKRIEDSRQLAAGLRTLAYRTEDEFSETKKVLARFLSDDAPPDIELPQQPPSKMTNERSEE